MKMNSLFTISYVLMLATCTLNAQHIQNNHSGDRMVTLGLNSDALTGLEIGYIQNTGLASEKGLCIYARFSVPILLSAKDKSLDTWEIKLGVNSELMSTDNFGIIGDIQFFLIHQNQVLGEFMPIGINVRFTPCYHFESGYLGIQINWNQTIATHITHSQYVRETFENLTTLDKVKFEIHPKDGWYGNTGSHFGFGIEGGAELGDQFFLYGDFGILKFSSPYTSMFDAMMMGQVPFYGNFRLAYKL